MLLELNCHQKHQIWDYLFYRVETQDGLNLEKKKLSVHFCVQHVTVAIMGMGSFGIPNDKCTQEINDILKISHDLLSEGTKTSISWIGGHADIEGNEISDKAAKEGALSKDQPLSTSTTFKGIKKTKEVILKTQLYITYLPNQKEDF